jgi:NDP-sugar pyrophosphorylase family protein
MKAMLLAAGAGTRLRPLTERLPKCMVPVAGKPLLEHSIIWLRDSGITDIVVNLRYMPGAVMGYFGDGSTWGVRLAYSVEEQALGTAGGVKKMADFFDVGPFVVWYGDNLSRCRMDRLAEAHRKAGALATVALFEREDVGQSGIVGLDDDKRILRFLEKPGPGAVFSHWVNAGIYLLDPAILDWIPDNTAYDFGRDLFPALLAARQPLYGYPLSAEEGLWWVDRPVDLARVEAEWREST